MACQATHQPEQPEQLGQSECAKRVKQDIDAVANTDIDVDGVPFYEGVNVAKLDDQDFAGFWHDLAEKNQRHFLVLDSGEGAWELRVGIDADAQSALSLGGFDSSYALPGFGLLSSDIPENEALSRLKKIFEGRLDRSEIFRRTMEYCLTRQDFVEVESAIETFPEFTLADQSPYRFIKTLTDAGGLRRVSLDAQGGEISLERAQGMTEDELDDIVAGFALETTEAGRQMVEERSPQRRLRSLLAAFPDRVLVFRDLLAYVKSNPCNYEAIEKLFAGRDFSTLRTIGMEKHVALKPSVFVNNMEKAGGLVWKNGCWNITREGEELLEELMRKEVVG